MERTLRWHSPKTWSGSFLTSFLVHFGVYGGVLLAANYTNFFARQETVLKDDTVYEMFDEVPEMDKVVHHATAAPQEKVVEEKVDTREHEMQDQNSDVTGRQTAKEAKLPVAADTKDTTNVPYFRIKPKYPVEALRAGAEGFVDFKIDILEDGTVDNARVIGGEKRNMFEAAARQAITKWKFKPFLDSTGKAVKKADVLQRIDFKMVDAV